MVASLSCSFKEFNDFVGPKIRNHVQYYTRPFKRQRKNICEDCKKKVKELHSAHIEGCSRLDIMKKTLEQYKVEGDRYLIPDLKKMHEEMEVAHSPVGEHFRFLCKNCHDLYDRPTNIKIKFDKFITENDDLETCLKKLFKHFSNIDIKSSILTSTYREKYPDKSSKPITNYLWELKKSGYLESECRGVYRLASKK